MTVWCHQPTILAVLRTQSGRRRLARNIGLLALFVALITTLLLSVSTRANADINATLSFQGRLLLSNGNNVPDGNYNVQFKIYEGGAGTDVDNPGGELVWTETHINKNNAEGVKVKNGLLSVELGALTPFGNSVDWNHSTLWLSMNIAGNSNSCTDFGTSPCLDDGEMLPMKRMTSSPYAMNAGAVGGKKVHQLLQLAQGVQTDNTENESSIFINKTAAGNLIQLQNTASDVFTVGNSGDIILGSNSDKSISVAPAANNETGKNITIAAGSGGAGSGTSGGNLAIYGGASGGTNGNGGNITISGGAGSGSGASGLVIIDTPTYKTITDDARCRTNGTAVEESCEIAISSVDSAASVVVEFSTDDQSATLPDPTITTPGRAYYVMAASNTKPFTLLMNGGGVRNEIILRAGDVLSLIWNGADWAATGTGGNVPVEYKADDNGKRVEVGDGSENGEPTLLTLDKAASAPTVSDDALFGSMYYDTTIGKFQCYEASGWGACNASPDTFITLSPEYSNAVTNGTGNGTMSSDFCSDALNINNGSNNQAEVCGTGETYNFYSWTSSEATDQTKSIYVTYKLPTNFEAFVAGSTSLMGRTDSADASVSYQIYRNENGNNLTSCGTAILVSTGGQSSWQTAAASGGVDPSACSFDAGDSIVIRIDLTSKNGANAYVGNLGFTYSNQ